MSLGEKIRLLIVMDIAVDCDHIAGVPYGLADNGLLTCKAGAVHFEAHIQDAAHELSFIACRDEGDLFGVETDLTFAACRHDLGGDRLCLVKVQAAVLGLHLDFSGDLVGLAGDQTRVGDFIHKDAVLCCKAVLFAGLTVADIGLHAGDGDSLSYVFQVLVLRDDPAVQAKLFEGHEALSCQSLRIESKGDIYGAVCFLCSEGAGCGHILAVTLQGLSALLVHELSGDLVGLAGKEVLVGDGICKFYIGVCGYELLACSLVDQRGTDFREVDGLSRIIRIPVLSAGDILIVRV